MSSEDDLQWLLQAAYEKGLSHGFTIGHGKPPRPEHNEALAKVADIAKKNLETSLKAGT